MPVENGREYKTCKLCGAKFYKDEPPNDKLNEFNWHLKQYCSKKHKHIMTNKFAEKERQQWLKNT